MEEVTPLDSEAKREAEVIRQVRENETQDTQPQTKPPTLSLDNLPQLAAPSASDLSSSSSDQALQMSLDSMSDNSFSRHAKRNSRGADFWNQLEERYRTPPPQMASLGRSYEDTTMETTPQSTGPLSGLVSVPELSRTRDRARSRSPTPQPTHPPTASEFRRKRRREDDLDPNLLKRRAVSPGMSGQSSPVLAHSPVVKDGGIFVAPPKSTPTLFGPELSGGSATSHGGIKRVGLQGMTEANDSLMNMSIEW